jgi:hypothetical protein
MMLGAGEGRALMNSQKPAQPTVAGRSFDVFAKKRPQRRQGLWSRM